MPPGGHSPASIEIVVPAHNEARRLPDGLAALAFLRQEGEYKMAPRPDLVLLDLNMPQMNGHSVLAAARRNPVLLSLPIVIFSGSGDQGDIDQSYALGANWYVRKPLGLEEFFQAVTTAVEQWATFHAEPHESATLIRADLKA